MLRSSTLINDLPFLYPPLRQYPFELSVYPPLLESQEPWLFASRLSLISDPYPIYERKMKGEFFRDNLSIFSMKPLFNNVRLIYKLINIPETELAPLVLRGETLLRLLSSTCNCESAAFPPNTSKDLVGIYIYIQLEKSKFLVFHTYATTCSGETGLSQSSTPSQKDTFVRNENE